MKIFMFKKLLSEVSKMRSLISQLINENRGANLKSFIQNNIDGPTQIVEIVAVTDIKFDPSHPSYGLNIKKRAYYKLELNENQTPPGWAFRDGAVIVHKRTGREYIFGELKDRKVLAYYYNDKIVNQKQKEWLINYEKQKESLETDNKRNIALDSVEKATINGLYFNR